MDARNSSEDAWTMVALIALSERQIDDGQGLPVDQVFAELRRKKGISS